METILSPNTNTENETEKIICTDIIEAYLIDNYPHIFNTTTRKEIKKWVECYLIDIK